ncbi:cytochrome P450 77A3-like [Cucurbita pepo subsp. pepo]|uniref:cytochrome P450 77A3-like n=1 Tax=Cucurbita pepo subsp. pepo TaxID=3664 RepID=UPI000C9D38A1|nr:cytochrome P450 77A3-like [Cucurbita pepo subsp. pepo]
MASFFSSSTLSLIAFCLSGLIFFLTRKPKTNRLKLPPGPPGWPLVGNLFQVARSRKPFFEYIEDQRRIYGPIFTLKMGTRTMVVLSDSNLVHEALIKKGAVFADRPRENPTRTIFSSNKFSVNAAVYGPIWRSLRRNMVENMLSPGKVKEFRGVREKAMEKFMKRLRDEAEANNGVVLVSKNARFAVFCILLTMCFGIEMEEEAVVKMDEILKSVLITLEPRIDDYLPILTPFFSKEKNRANFVRKQQVKFVVGLINRRRRALENPASDGAATSFSYLDTLFDLKFDSNGGRAAATDEELVTLCSEFLNGGTDTTATAIEWGMAELIENPGVQRKVLEEIRATVGEKKVEENDLEKMVYLQSVVKEVLRKHPPTFFTLTHSVTAPAKLGGYDIPKDTNVEFFLPAIGKDPKLWKNPEKFEPERFSSGEEEADITGVTGVRMMPFGVGRRICPGLGMGTVHIHLMLARMLQEFEWTAYPAASSVDFSWKMEFTVVMKNPLRATIKPRV